MNNFTRLLLVFLGLTLSSVTLAQRPHWTYVGAGYAQTEYDDSCEMDGWYVNGSLRMNERFFLAGERKSVDGGGCEDTSSQVGVGLRGEVGRFADIYALASFVNQDLGSEDDTGYNLSAGVRGIWEQDIELRGYFGLVEVGDYEDTFIGAGFSYWFQRGEFALTGDVSRSDEDGTNVLLGFRFNFYDLR